MKKQKEKFKETKQKYGLPKLFIFECNKHYINKYINICNKCLQKSMRINNFRTSFKNPLQYLKLN